MASLEIVSNLKQITSGTVPTTITLANGEFAYGLIGGKPKLYGNTTGVITDYSNFLITAPVTSVAGKTGAVTLTKSNVGLENVDNTADANKTVAAAKEWRGSDTRAVNSKPSVYMGTGPMKSVYEFKNVSDIGLSSIFTGTYCYVQTMTPWGDDSGGYPVQLATQSDGTNTRYAIRSGSSNTTWGTWQRIATMDLISSGTPYVVLLSTSNWSGTDGNYTYVINASTHGKGTYPVVRALYNNKPMEIDYSLSSGNVTLISNAKLNLRVIIS